MGAGVLSLPHTVFGTFPQTWLEPSVMFIMMLAASLGNFV